MLCFGQRKYPFLPFVISLFTYAIFFTPAFHSQSTVPAFRDSPGPHGQLGLLIQLLQFCAHNKKHPRIADSTRESRILSATIREYCVTLSFCTQAAATFDGYMAMIAEDYKRRKTAITGGFSRFLVRDGRLELPTSCSQSRRATNSANPGYLILRLFRRCSQSRRATNCATPRYLLFISLVGASCRVWFLIPKATTFYFMVSLLYRFLP